MPVVQETLTSPQGQAQSGVGVRVELRRDNAREQDLGFDGTNTIIFSSDAETDGSGQWSMDLVPNDQIQVAGTFYRLTYTYPGRRTKVQDIVVPNVSGPHEVGDLRLYPSEIG